ncbi:MAG TPA: hypothetical protein VKT33_01265 [Candidatus Angelobacter sp.]|nr:hypothetical protein [Candidatus Angelobacter sp.]
MKKTENKQGNQKTDRQAKPIEQPPKPPPSLVLRIIKYLFGHGGGKKRCVYRKARLKHGQIQIIGRLTHIFLRMEAGFRPGTRNAAPGKLTTGEI